MADSIVDIISSGGRSTPYASQGMADRARAKRQMQVENTAAAAAMDHGSAGAYRPDMQREAIDDFSRTDPGQAIEGAVHRAVDSVAGTGELPPVRYTEDGRPIQTVHGVLPPWVSGATGGGKKIIDVTTKVANKMIPQSGAQAIDDIGARPLVDAMTAGAKASAPHVKQAAKTTAKFTKEQAKKTPARIDRASEILSGTPKGTASTARVARKTGKRTRKIAVQGTKNRKGFNKAVAAQEKAKGAPLTLVEKRSIIKNQRNTQGLSKVVTKPRKRMKPQFKPSTAKPKPKPKPKPSSAGNKSSGQVGGHKKP